MKDVLGQEIEKGDVIIYTTSTSTSLQMGSILEWDYHRPYRGDVNNTLPQIKLLGNNKTIPGWTFPERIVSVSAILRNSK